MSVSVVWNSLSPNKKILASLFLAVNILSFCAVAATLTFIYTNSGSTQPVDDWSKIYKDIYV